MRRRALRTRLQYGMTALLILSIIGAFGGCSTKPQVVDSGENTSEENTIEEARKDTDSVTDRQPSVVIDGEELSYRSEVSLDYAECFHIYRYEGDYSLITMDDGSAYLLIPEGQDLPESVVYRPYSSGQQEGLSDSENGKSSILSGASTENAVIILQKPVNRIYMSSSGAMALFDSADAMDHVMFSSLDADSWYIEHAREAIYNGDIYYAGKYSEPDYELLVEEDCSLALENTMILHKPETKEKLEELGIPVMIERSSYESHPLGRTEWIKVYGELTGHLEQAETFFDTQKQIVTDLEQTEPTGKTVAFFYVSESGTIVTRKSSDYVAKMIGIAGGKYVFEHLGEDEGNASSTVNMTMEDFYVTAKDADYLVYNATIDDPMTSIDELIAENELFRDFKAVQEDHVWCTGKNMYQSTDVIGEIIQSFHRMMTEEDAEDLTYMVRIH